MDSVYIKNVLDSSTEDFRYFIRKYKNLAFSVAVSVVKNEFDAEEVVQDAFYKSISEPEIVQETIEFQNMVLPDMINEAFKRLQKVKNEISAANQPKSSDVEDITETFRGMNAEEQKFLVSESLKKIPPKESLTLQLFYLDGNGIDEITNLTGWSETNVKVILHRARKHLLDVVNTMLEGEFKTVAK